jgi:lipoprotein
MKKILFSLILGAFVMVGCGSDEAKTPEELGEKVVKTIKNNPVDMAFLIKTDSKDEQDKIAKKIEKEIENNKSDKILDASVYRIDVLDPKHAELVIKVQFSSGERIRRFNIEKFDEIWYLKNPL